MVTATVIGLSKTKVVAAGTKVMGVWGNNQPVPGIDGFHDALDDYGTVTQLTYLSAHHVVLGLERDMTQFELQVAIARSNGGTAANVSAITGFDTVFAIEELAGDARQSLIDAISAVTNSFSSASKFSLWLSRYGVYVIAGVVVLALVLIVVFARRKSK